MCTSQVCNMNIVADTSTITGIVIVSKYLQFALTKGSFHYAWQKIFRLLFKTTNFSIRIITGSIKVTQSSKLKTFKLVVPVHKLFNFELCKAIIINWLLRMIFIHWKVLRFTKSCCRRRENHNLAVVLYSRIHNVQSSSDIIDRILFRGYHRFSGSLKCSKMNKSVKTTCKSLIQITLNQNVSINKFVFRKKIAAKSTRKVVKYSNLMTSLHHLFYNMASDIAGTTNYQNFHFTSSL